MKQSIEADGVTNVELWFIQLGTNSKTPKEVADHIGEYPTPVLYDDTDQTIWEAFASTWYEAVLLDPEGCIVTKFGPFSPDAPDPDEIIPLWKGAALGSLPCENPDTDPIEPDPIEPAPESEPDIFAPDVISSDTQDITDVQSEVFDAVEDVLTDALTDVPTDVPTDTPADLPPDIPADTPADIPAPPPWWCQVNAPAAPAAPGDSLTSFTCVDMNPASATEGEVVSKASLKELVWLGYAGSGG